jgi:hypothetical protein
MIEELAKMIPPSMMEHSGKAFYSGRAAFSQPSRLYVLGLNPGGSPDKMLGETVRSHTTQILASKDPDWSAYSDESWENARPGTSGLQPRVLHVLRRLNMDPRKTPSSNVIFTRSTRENTFSGSFEEHAKATWLFHDAVIKNLKTSVVLCFGKTAGNWVARQLSAGKFVGEFVEQNNRRWRSVVHENLAGITVITATHPSIVDWTAPATDPSGLIEKFLGV